MNLVTVADLLARAEQTAVLLEASTEPVAAAQWESFDQTVYRALTFLADPRATDMGPADRAALPLLGIVRDYPNPLRPVLTESTYTLPQAARLLRLSKRTVRTMIRRADLTASRAGHAFAIPGAGCVR